MEKEICYECNSEKVIRSKDYTSVIIKGERIEYEEEFFLCEECGNSYYDEIMIRKNLLTPQDIYRKKHGLLTSGEIKNIRKFYNLSQENLALILNWGAKTITRYETKSIQDSSHNDVLQQLRNNPAFLLEKLRENKDNMGSDFQYLYDNIVSIVNNFGEVFSSIQALSNEYAVYNEKSEYNGYRKVDINSIKEIICYIAKSMTLHKVKLMKMLWYTDMTFFKENGHGLTGLMYLHHQMGALPLGHNNILNVCSDVVKVEEIYYRANPDQVSYRISALDKNRKCNLNKNGKKYIDEVIARFGDMNARDIVDHMHNEKAYRETHDNEFISYKYAEFIKL